MVISDRRSRVAVFLDCKVHKWKNYCQWIHSGSEDILPKFYWPSMLLQEQGKKYDMSSINAVQIFIYHLSNFFE